MEEKRTNPKRKTLIQERATDYHLSKFISSKINTDPHELHKQPKVSTTKILRYKDNSLTVIRNMVMV